MLLQVTFDKAIDSKKSELKAKYSIDNNPLFPGKWIYTNSSTGFQFDLNTGQLMVWASHLVNFCCLALALVNNVHISRLVGLWPLNKPPATPLFDCQQWIKKPSPPPSANVQVAPTLVISAPVAAPQVPATSTSLITELLLLQLLQTQQVTMHASHSIVPHQQVLFSTAPQVLVAAIPPSLPPSPAKHRRVTLDEYCAYYDISDVDCTHLQKLDFQPGDPIEKLDRVECHDEGGFQQLGWDWMLAKNRQFRWDVRSGTMWA